MSVRKKPRRKDWPEFADEPGDEIARWLDYGDELEPALLVEDCVIRELLEIDLEDCSPENLARVASFAETHGAAPGRAVELLQRAGRIFDRYLDDPDSVDRDDWTFVCETLNRALPSTLVRMMLSDAVDELDEETWSLSLALAVQLWNLIVEDRPVIRCENENCQRYFSKQRGNPNATKRRSDTRFCSEQCANATKARRRRAQQRTLNNQSLGAPGHQARAPRAADEENESTTKKGKKQ